MRQADTDIVVSCSALRRVYRDCLRDAADDSVGFVHLVAERHVLQDRMRNRVGHFMPLSLLDSQIALLEPLQSDELGVVVDVNQTLEQIVAQALVYINARQSSRA